MLTSLFGSFGVLAFAVQGDAESTVMLQLADSSRMKPTDWNPNIMSYNIERDVFDTKRKSHKSKLDKVVTLTTQTSVDRIESMERQCLSWEGTCSAAVFVPEKIIPTELFNTMEQMTKNVEAGGGCLIISVIHGIPDDDEVDEYDAGYPINALRNLATDESTGDFVFALDVDFVASEYFLDRLRDYQDNGLSEAAKTAKPVALVIPAFWIPNEGPHAVPDKDRPDPAVFLPRNWPDLAKSKAELFKVSLRDVAHGPTNFTKWHAALFDKKNKSDDWTYHVDFAEYFEPYVIVNKHLAPRYDERFRGYGFNKAEFLHHLNADSFDFQVLATDAFVLHGEHEKSVSQDKYGNRLTDLRAQDENGKPLSQVGKVEVLWSSFKQELAPNFARHKGFHADEANTHLDTTKE